MVAIEQGVPLTVAQVATALEFDREVYGLPHRVRAWLGLADDNPTLKGDTRAAVANDDEGWNFIEIADAIEAQYIKPYEEATAQ